MCVCPHHISHHSVRRLPGSSSRQHMWSGVMFCGACLHLHGVVEIKELGRKVEHCFAREQPCIICMHTSLYTPDDGSIWDDGAAHLRRWPKEKERNGTGYMRGDTQRQVSATRAGAVSEWAGDVKACVEHFIVYPRSIGIRRPKREKRTFPLVLRKKMDASTGAGAVH